MCPAGPNERKRLVLSDTSACPKCSSVYVYEDGNLNVCPECGEEWPIGSAADDVQVGLVVRDVHGNVLSNGDSVTVIKDLKVKGTSAVVKVGTKVRNIRLVDGDHNIDCKIDGIGQMSLKSEYVKRA